MLKWSVCLNLVYVLSANNIKMTLHLYCLLLHRPAIGLFIYLLIYFICHRLSRTFFSLLTHLSLNLCPYFVTDTLFCGSCHCCIQNLGAGTSGSTYSEAYMITIND